MAKTIKIQSPIFVITSGKAPTADTLPNGAIAIGKVNGSDEMQLFVNAGGSVVNVPQEMWDKVNTELESVKGNAANIKSLVEDIDTRLGTFIGKVGAANGIAQLDASGLIPESQLPSYVDDVLEFDNLAAFPTTGESGKIYVAIDTNLTYRWSGTQFTPIASSLALGETSSTAYAGDKGAALASKVATLETNLSTESSTRNTQITKVAPKSGTFTSAGDSVTLALKNQANETIVTTGAIPTATTAKAGVMSASDKTNLDAVYNDAILSATINEETEDFIDISFSSNGNYDKKVILTEVTTEKAGLMTSPMLKSFNSLKTDFSKLKIYDFFGIYSLAELQDEQNEQGRTQVVDQVIFLTDLGRFVCIESWTNNTPDYHVDGDWDATRYNNGNNPRTDRMFRNTASGNAIYRPHKASGASVYNLARLVDESDIEAAKVIPDQTLTLQSTSTNSVASKAVVDLLQETTPANQTFTGAADASGVNVIVENHKRTQVFDFTIPTDAYPTIGSTKPVQSGAVYSFGADLQLESDEVGFTADASKVQYSVAQYGYPTITSDLAAATTAKAGVMSAADKTNLDTINASYISSVELEVVSI